jgi:hypothetical protein
LAEQEKPPLEEVLFTPDTPCSPGPDKDLAEMISALCREAQARAARSRKASQSNPRQSRIGRPKKQK